MRSLKLLHIVFATFCLQSGLWSQPDSIKNRVQFKIGSFYNSNLHYYGRTDSMQSSGFFPIAELWLGRNFYINAAPVFVNNRVQKFDYAGTVATAGYQFNDLKRWAGNFYIVRPFYRSNTPLVQSALKTQLAGTLTLQTRWLNMTGGMDVKFSDRTDIGATAAFDHPFRIQVSNKSVLVIDPTATLNAGTQQFATTRYRKSNFLILPGYEQAITENVKKFNILSYEVSMPVIFAIGKFQILAIPAFVSPQNLVSSEQGMDMVYVTVGAKMVL